MSWKTVALGDICEFTRGLTYSKIDEVEFSNNAVLRATNIDLESNKLNLEEIRYINSSVKINEDKKVKLNDILICTASGSKSHLGKVALINEQLDMAFGGFMAVLRVKENIEAKFLFNYLTSDIFLNHISKLADGANINNLKFSQIQNLKINLPPLATQQKIVAKLDAIFAEIDTATAAAEANVNNAEALFQSYLNEVFSSNENLTKLKDCTQIKPPKSEIKNLKGNTSVSFMPMESLGINDKFTISKQSKDLESVSGSYTYFTEGDVLLAKITPCFENGKLGIASNLVNGIGFGSSEYIVFRPNKIIDKEWLYYFLNRESFRVLGSQHMSGSVGHKRVTKEFIEETLIPLIPVAKQKEFVGKIDNLFLQSQILKSASKSKIRELTLLKQSILQKAFSGELVKD